VPGDFSTPEKALASLEDAYNRKDIVAAVAAKDFLFEAREMLLSIKNPPVPPDEETVKLTAEVLELGFLRRLRETAFQISEICAAGPLAKIHCAKIWWRSSKSASFRMAASRGRYFTPQEIRRAGTLLFFLAFLNKSPETYETKQIRKPRK